MDRKKVPIVLVLSFSPSFCGKLNEILVRLGFTNIDTLEWDDLLDANIEHFNKVFVIPLSQKNVLSRNLKPGFETIRKMPVKIAALDEDGEVIKTTQAQKTDKYYYIQPVLAAISYVLEF